MRPRLAPLPALAAASLALALLLAAPAQAAHPAQGDFGINHFDLTFTEADGTFDEQAGTHPYAMTISLAPNLDKAGVPEGWLRDFVNELPSGLVADTTAYKRCTNADFLTRVEGISSCPLDSAVGINAFSANTAGQWRSSPVYNLTPPPGVLLRLGFTVLSANVIVDAGLRETAPNNGFGASRNTSQLVEVLADKLQLWGDPSDPGHDDLRGACGVTEVTLPGVDPAEFEFAGAGGECEEHVEGIAPDDRPFLSLPTFCAEPLFSRYEALSWEGDSAEGRVPTHDAGGNPAPLRGCAALPALKAPILAAPTNRAAQSPTGLDLSIDVEDQGLTSVEGRSQSRIRKAVVTLPEGFTANPSLAEGLGVCSEADLARETLAAGPGEGCPEASKIGTVEVESPLISKPLGGALYVAEPYHNPFDSLIALYIVVKDPGLGVLVRQPVKVEPDPRTGRLVSTTPDIPPTAVFSHFRVHFREGGRSPLVTPPLCGSYEAKAELYPWSGAAPTESTSSFKIIAGPGGGSCPPGGTPPFEPGFEAGSANNAAAAFSPFSMRLTRRDGDQDLTRFDVTLPSGTAAVLAGVGRCPDAAIAAAKAKSGLAERAEPSCPADSKIGTIEAGAGVGSQLTYVPGSIYLAGPFNGAPASVAAVVPAVAGPFDVGTVVVREALRIDPRTGEVAVDGAHSDPIPHILAGIPLVVRDIQARVDRDRFTFNPTDCKRQATEASIWGGGANPFSALDDSPVAREAPFQAASCLELGFRPHLSLRLKGGARRGAFPALRLAYLPRPHGDANLRRLSLRFPHSEFIEQGHFRTICTRVQFAAGEGFGSQCPKGSVYGHARVFTPVLDKPVTGKVFLRSSSHNLPDVVLALQGPPELPVKVEVPTKIDSVHGGLRAIAAALPDIPVSKAIVRMQGGQKGLFVNSTDLCLRTHRANVGLAAHNGRHARLRPVLRIKCAKHRRHGRHRHRHGRR